MTKFLFRHIHWHFIYILQSEIIIMYCEFIIIVKFHTKTLWCQVNIIYQILLKLVKSLLRYGISPKIGRFHAHCPTFTPNPMQPFRTIFTIKFNTSKGLVCWVITLLVILNIIIYAVAMVINRFHTMCGYILRICFYKFGWCNFNGLWDIYIKSIRGRNHAHFLNFF